MDHESALNIVTLSRLVIRSRASYRISTCNPTKSLQYNIIVVLLPHSIDVLALTELYQYNIYFDIFSIFQIKYECEENS